MSGIQRSPRPSPAGLSNRERDEVSHLVAQRNTLVDRLETGSRQIEQIRLAGENVDTWEQFWVRLLHQYEQVCDKLEQIERRSNLQRAG